MPLDSPATDALVRLLPQFKETTGISVNVVALSYENLYSEVLKEDVSSKYDLIRIDMAWLAELAKKIFMPLDKDIECYKEISSSFLTALGQDYTSLCGIPYAFPFDPSVQIFFYNQDAFENSRMKRLYYEMYKKELEIPSDYADYDRISRFFTKRYNNNSVMEYGTALTFGTPGVASCDFMPRIMDSLDDSVTFETDAIEKALEDYVKTRDCTDGSVNIWWKDTIGKFISGSVSMITVFMNHASQIANSKYSKVVGKVGCSLVPGHHPLLGGGSIGISKNTKEKDAAFEFLRWVFSDEISTLYTMLGGISPRASVYNKPEILSMYPWLRVAEESFRCGTRSFTNVNVVSTGKLEPLNNGK